MIPQVRAAPDIHYNLYSEYQKALEATTIRPHWIDDYGNQKCSYCGTSYPDLFPTGWDSKYCPNCGIRMCKI